MRPREQRFRTAFSDSYADVVNFARRRADADRAEDVAAETFLTAWRRIIDLDAAPPLPEDDIDAAILRVDLAVAWGRLTASEQEVLGLVIFERLTAAQVGTVRPGPREIGRVQCAYTLTLTDGSILRNVQAVGQ